MSTLPTALLMAQHHSFFVFGFMSPMKLAAINAIKVYQDEIAKAGDLRENKIIVVRDTNFDESICVKFERQMIQ